MVLIDIKVAFGPKLEIKAAMPGKQFQHVIEEADTS
jgi:hypothetical protein